MFKKKKQEGEKKRNQWIEAGANIAQAVHSIGVINLNLYTIAGLFVGGYFTIKHMSAFGIGVAIGRFFG